MSDNTGLIFCCELDGTGGGRELGLSDIEHRGPGCGTFWVHLDYTGNAARQWLSNRSGIDPVIVDALTAEETRPRSLVHKDGMLLILRGVNLNPNTDPEDMVSVRLWIDSRRIVSMRRRRIMAMEDLRQALIAGSGPAGPGDFLNALSDRLVLRMGTVISEMDDAIDALEDEIISEQNHELRQKIANIRRAAISMRRYLAPQRDVMARLHNERVDWLGDAERMRLREVADRTIRYVEDLDSIRERAAVTQEELNSRLTEHMNRTMYVLSIVAGIFLPLGLLTGLLGINVGGIPGTDNPWAFTIFCIILTAIAGLQIWLFKRMRWM